MKKVKVYRGCERVSQYELEALIMSHIEELLKEKYVSGADYGFDWEIDDGYFEGGAFSIHSLETDEELEERRNKQKEINRKDKEAKEKLKLKKEENERRLYEELKAKFEGNK